jgi:hypothetical protein
MSEREKRNGEGIMAKKAKRKARPGRAGVPGTEKARSPSQRQVRQTKDRGEAPVIRGKFIFPFVD